MLKRTGFSAQEILLSPNFRKLSSARAALRWGLSAATLLVFFGLIALVWTARAAMGSGMGGSSIPIWFGLVFAMVVLVVVFTGIYVRQSNSRFDELTKDLIREFGQ